MSLLTRTRTVSGLAAARTGITIALAALIVPIGLTGAFAQEPPTGTTTIDSAQVNRGGTVTVTYTVECSEGATIFGSGASVLQGTPDKGRFGGKEVFGGQGIDEIIPCDPDGVSLTVTVTAFSGRFVPGTATVFAGAFICNEFECIDASDTQEIRLRR